MYVEKYIHTYIYEIPCSNNLAIDNQMNYSTKGINYHSNLKRAEITQPSNANEVKNLLPLDEKLLEGKRYKLLCSLWHLDRKHSKESKPKKVEGCRNHTSSF